ncbi:MULTISPECIES: hypothetical protein [unclassified Mesorhizobium]|uniref:hypothetical protein n=1 Tax=unclassified Mesorhizobium TaxID=325217 RepID=UPI000BB0C04F|nr:MULTISPECIES: hypothetical protein [unclassified Mesorhizobium]PBB24091.1 hypothetical protein CK232_25445 [Mesorhizobium sp. WSM4304]PBB72749.1 hypothetical protein CK227_23915 [Mesorhizobium sp. WSM4308]
MEHSDAHHVPGKGNAPGAEARFAFDRMAVERFRRAFPRASWNDECKSWFVPRKTATRRIDRWLTQEAEMFALHGDSKGRDAFVFDSISSSYLEVSDDLRVRTPYSKTVLEELRAIPWASWDDELRAWRVPFRSFEELRRRWPNIEMAARHAEPAERRRRREAARDTEAYKASKMRNAERRRHRYPLPAEGLPPLGRPVATAQYGIVVFNQASGEPVEPSALMASYPNATRKDVDCVWGRWRSATLAELVRTWPARNPPGADELLRGWWQPTLAELRVARRDARSLERKELSRKLRRLADLQSE